MYVTTFIVQGRGTFPADMLRYDACYPAHPESVDAIFEPPGELKTVVLYTRHPTKFHGITKGRWASFGWQVLDNITTRKF